MPRFVLGEQTEGSELQRQGVELREIRLQAVLEEEPRDRDDPGDRAEHRAVWTEPAARERSIR